MKLTYITLITTLFLCLASWTNGSFAQSQISPEELFPDVIQNESNIKKPNFTWKAVENAENYQLYVKSELIYSGNMPIFPPDESYPYEEFAYGYYQAYIIAQLADGSRVRGKAIDFIIGMAKPELLVLKDKEVLYQPTPVFKWTSVIGAAGYELYLDDTMIYDGSDTSFKINGAAPYDRHIWTVVAKNEFQKVRSDRGFFEVKIIPAPQLRTPANGFSETILVADQLPELSWNSVELKGEKEPITYELYVGNMIVYEGKNTEWKFDTMIDAGQYPWHVIAKFKDQKSEPSEIWNFRVKEKLGMNVGLKAGMNLTNTTDQLSQTKPNVTAGPYVDQRIFRKSKFELRAELDTFFEIRKVAFESKDNVKRQVDDVRILSTNLTIPVGLKPQFYLNKIVTLYGIVGTQVSFGLYNIIRRNTDDFTQRFTDQTNSVFVDLLTCVGSDFTFKNIRYLFGQPLKLSAELRFTMGFMNTFNKSFLTASDKAIQFTFLVGNKIIDF